MKTLTVILGTLFVAALGFAVGAVSGFLLAISLHLHGPGEVAGIGGIFNGISSGIFYGLIAGLVSAIVAGILGFRLFKRA
jgi:hypothetical protein